MMRTILLFLLVILNLNVNAQKNNPFSSLKYNKVIVCDFENNGESVLPIVDPKGNLTGIVKKHAQLDTDLIKQLNSKLGDKKSFGQAQADCFEPHLGILYYKDKQVLAQIEICLGCNGLSSSVDIPAQKQAKVGHGNKVYYHLQGLSKSFRKFINSILKKYNFSHQMRRSSVFD